MKTMLKQGLLAAALLTSTAPVAMAQECADADRKPSISSTVEVGMTDRQCPARKE
ncbi:hypothetical protein M1D34_02295 [Ensifer sp. D2-11]